jgi:hypothetical protein
MHGVLEEPSATIFREVETAGSFSILIHLYKIHGVTPQKITDIFITVRTSDLTFQLKGSY